MLTCHVGSGSAPLSPFEFLMDILNTNCHRYVAQALVFISMPSILLAAWVASSRIVDNRHHPADVVGGSAFGSLVAVSIFLLVLPAIHRDYFGRFTSSGAGEPEKESTDNQEPTLV